MILSMTSQIIGLLFSTLMIVVIYFYFTHSDKNFDIDSVRFILLCCVLALIRPLLSVELPFTVSLEDWYILPRLQKLFLLEIHRIPLWRLLILLSLTISFLILMAKALHYRRLQVLLNRIHPRQNAQIDGIIQNRLSERKKKFSIHIVYLNDIHSPMVFGLVKKYLILPTSVVGNKNIEYILYRELEHFFHHDLWIKACGELLTILFWWNPQVYFLRHQLSNALELHNDLTIMRSASEFEKLDYIEGLYETVKEAADHPNFYGYSLIHRPNTFLKKRFSSVLNMSKHTKGRFTRIIPTFIVLFLFILSFGFVFEPCAVPSNIQETTFDIEDLDNAYLIKENNTYRLYIDGKFMSSFEGELPDILSNIKIKES